MQILKGDIFKSVTVESILKSTNSYCVVYYETQLPFENYYVTTLATIDQLEGYLQEFIDYKNPSILYDYFIIYTNNKEEELSELINWLKGKELDFHCKCILLTCKPNEEEMILARYIDGDFYQCDNCGCTEIMSGAYYCPGCGKRIYFS